MPKTLDDQIRLVQLLRETGKGLTKWEEDFLESLDDQLSGGRSLSPKQMHTLERIEEDRT